MKIIVNDALKDAMVLKHKLHMVLNPGLVSALNIVQIDTGEQLLTQDSEPLDLYFHVEGKLRIERDDTDGNHVVDAFITPLSVIGEVEIFSEIQSKNRCSVQAVSDSLLLSLPVAMVRKHSLRDPNFLLFICHHLCTKLVMSCILHSGGSASAEAKLRKYLSLKFQNEGLSFQLENRESLAAMLGVSGRQLNRALLKLAEQGVIRYKNKSLEIINIEELL